MRSLSRVAVALVLAATSVACSSEPEPTAAPTSTPSPSGSATASPSPDPGTGPTTGPSPVGPTLGPAFVADTREDTGDPSGAVLGLKAVRAAGQTGYDRVVFELASAEPGRAGWVVRYVDEPQSDGSGEPVAVQGSAYLQVILRATGYPDDTGVPEPSPRRFSPGGTTAVREVVLDGTFEGQSTAFIGVSARLPFRVFRLSNPERVVVDVRTS
jgi:hypothetical protein